MICQNLITFSRMWENRIFSISLKRTHSSQQQQLLKKRQHFRWTLPWFVYNSMRCVKKRIYLTTEKFPNNNCSLIPQSSKWLRFVIVVLECKGTLCGIVCFLCEKYMCLIFVYVLVLFNYYGHIICYFVTTIFQVCTMDIMNVNLIGFNFVISASVMGVQHL